MNVFSRTRLRTKLAPGRLLAVVLILLMLTPTIALAEISEDVPNTPPPTRSYQLDPHSSAIKSCLNGTGSISPTNTRMAFVMPTFTLTPYANFKHSFYEFYIKYAHSMGPITDDLNLLRTHVVGNWSSPIVNDEKPLYTFLTSAAAARCGLVMGQNLKVITDMGVDDGGLFTGTVRQFDVLILGHEEYSTRVEYDQFKQFVASGGRIVEMSGNTFWAQVNFSKSTGIETFVAGHGFQFDGKHAWKSSLEPFDTQSAGWFGSSFANNQQFLHGALVNVVSRIGQGMKIAFQSDQVFTGYNYPHNEVNYLRNLTNTHIIASFYLERPTNNLGGFRMPKVPIDSYAHRYVRGEVDCFCVFGENLITHDTAAQFFLVYAVTYGSGIQPVNSCITILARYCLPIGPRV
jgi:hypothetical protein